MGCTGSKLTQSDQAILDIGQKLHLAQEYSTACAFVDALQEMNEADRLLALLDDDVVDHYRILVKSRIGKNYFVQDKTRQALEHYDAAIAIAERKIAERCRGLYLMLQRYSECMLDKASVFLKSAERERKPAKKTAKVARAEIILLRCIETVEEGHNRRSDLLYEPLMVLASLYRTMGYFSRAELMVRRCSGILIFQYGHDHPQVKETQSLLDDIIQEKDNAITNDAAIKMQKTFKMHLCRNALESRLQRRVRRHIELPRQRTPTPPSDYLAQLVNADGGAGHEDTETGTITSPAPSNLQEQNSDRSLKSSGSSYKELREPATADHSISEAGATTSNQQQQQQHSSQTSSREEVVINNNNTNSNNSLKPKAFRGIRDPILWEGAAKPLGRTGSMHGSALVPAGQQPLTSTALASSPGASGAGAAASTPRVWQVPMMEGEEDLLDDDDKSDDLVDIEMKNVGPLVGGK